MGGGEVGGFGCGGGGGYREWEGVDCLEVAGSAMCVRYVGWGRGIRWVGRGGGSLHRVRWLRMSVMLHEVEGEKRKKRKKNKNKKKKKQVKWEIYGILSY